VEGPQVPHGRLPDRPRASRLLWVGRERTEEGFRGFFQTFGKVRAEKLQFVASDMWKPYIKLIAEFAGQAIHVLDRFHIVAKVNKAVDDVRASEARQLRRDGYEPILKHTRWCFLKRPKTSPTPARQAHGRTPLQPAQCTRLPAQRVARRLLAVRQRPLGQLFLDKWCTRALRSRLEPMKKIARTLRSHHDLILNWFIAKREISSGAVEGMNTNAKLAIRKARGFRTYEASKPPCIISLATYPSLLFSPIDSVEEALSRPSIS